MFVDPSVTWHSLEINEVMDRLNTGPEGLDQNEAQRRLNEVGPNRLKQGKKKSIISIFLDQFLDFMIWILIAAAVISILIGEWVDSIIIIFVVVLNSVLGTIQESKAEAALEALKNMMAPMARVMREGGVTSIAASELVPGDLVLLEAGDSVPADIRLIECASIKAEEAALTGESLPVEKGVLPIGDIDAALGDRTDMVFMGTVITYGRGNGVVVMTGMDTQMGKIAVQLEHTQKESTPLSQKLNQISNTLSIGVLAIAAIVFAIGMLGGRELFDMFLTAVSLAVAAIPEGLVAVITIVLALGMSRMAQRGAIIRRLPAVETLGSTQVICSDKTGTLTQNRMSVVKTVSQDEPLLFEAMGHCNDAMLNSEGVAVGDPTETALINYIIKNGSWDLRKVHNRVRAAEIPFDSQRKRSTVAVKLPGGKLRIFVKGAPEVLIKRCIMSSQELENAERDNEIMAESALRVLAFAYKDADSINVNDPQGVESGLKFIGLAGMMDPPRPEAKEAISICRSAGILPVMITGDHKATAMAVAEELGILSDRRRAITGAELENMDDQTFERSIQDIGVYARVSPEHKNRIVDMWQHIGKVVAMTGDGVNDAPALKSADIGVGMGITGTDVSKEASDMVLTDDNFASIVSAVGEGRRIFDNIKKTTMFLLSSNTGEVLAVFVSTLIGWRLLDPVHILWINLVTDTFPALALGVEPAEGDIMERSPRDKKTPFLTIKDWLKVLHIGAVEACLALAAYIIGFYYYSSAETGTVMAFLTLSFAQIFAMLGFQNQHFSVLKMKVKQHKALWLAFLISSVLQLAVVLIAPLRDIFDIVALNAAQYGLVLLLCLLMLIYIEFLKFLNRKRESKKGR